MSLKRIPQIVVPWPRHRWSDSSCLDRPLLSWILDFPLSSCSLSSYTLFKLYGVLEPMRPRPTSVLKIYLQGKMSSAGTHLLPRAYAQCVLQNIKWLQISSGECKALALTCRHIPAILSGIHSGWPLYLANISEAILRHLACCSWEWWWILTNPRIKFREQCIRPNLTSSVPLSRHDVRVSFITIGIYESLIIAIIW